MNYPLQEKNNRQVAHWLLLGVAMIVIQILLGGITRLTESGLSITEWKPITGTLPPLNDAAWVAEFDKYKNTDQFKYVHSSFSLSQFKFIFFWEWFHRVWARLMGMVFIAGFVYFIVKKKYSRPMISTLIVLFFLGALQGAIGWLMVKSGLVPEKFYVGHVELTTHFLAAVILLVYTLWFALGLLPNFKQKLLNAPIKNLLVVIAVLLLIKLIYGGFMAGLRAGQTATTWPSINHAMLPPGMMEMQPAPSNFFNNPLLVHFIHRGLAYLLFILAIVFFFVSKNLTVNTLFAKYRLAFIVLVMCQVLLGIVTVLNAANLKVLVVLGVLHQFVAILVVMALTTLLFLVTQKKTTAAPV
jgi:cytochrome c oxidase assembly protein subunit 15